MSVKQNIRFRVYIVYTIFALFALMVLGRVGYVQYVKGDELKKMSRDRYIDREELEPIRGNIYSADGSLLSTTLPVFNIYWDAMVCEQDTFDRYHRELAEGLSSLLRDRSANSYDALLNKARRNKRRYQLVKSKVSFSDYLKVKELPIFRLSKNTGGLCTDITNRRVNPFGLLANRSIGRYSQTKPSVGLELYYNDYLQGRQGSRLVKLIAGGTKVPLDGSEIDPEKGKDLYTAIDVNLQEVAENSLMEVVQQNTADFGTCIVMEVHTGRIKALANLGKQADGSYWEDYNYALLKQHPGSTFKLISLMSLLEDSIVDLDDFVHVGDGTMKTNSGIIKDVHFEGEDISVKTAFAESSNTAFARMIYHNYKDRPEHFIKFLNKIGLDKTSEVDLVGEPEPFFSNTQSKTWNNYSLAYMAHGYEMLITPMKMCQIYNAVANNGIMTRPHIAERITDYGLGIQDIGTSEVRQICSKRTAQKLKSAMAQVVKTGTGSQLNNEHYSVGGKTGTAKWVDDKTKFDDNIYTASFIGTFPLDDPMYTICVSVKLPRYSASYSGSRVALPVFKAVADRIYARQVCMRNMRNNWYATPTEYVQKVLLASSDSKAIVRHMQNPHLQVQTYDETKSAVKKSAKKVPNVQGLSLKDALYVLENSGYTAEFSGVGKIASQSPEPNTLPVNSKKVTLKLN